MHVIGWQPQGRAGHACAMSGSRLYVFGGHDGRRARADLCMFDFGMCYQCCTMLIVSRHKEMEQIV